MLHSALRSHAAPRPSVQRPSVPAALRMGLFSKCTTPATPGVPPTDKFCARPPTPFVSLPAYTGTWYNIFNSGLANMFAAPGKCVTANYTLASTSPPKIDVLNCNAPRGQPGEKAICVRAEATKRPGTNSTSKLQVFFPAVPPNLGNPGSYNIAALIGNAKLGYIGAGVFFCSKTPDGINRTGIFILSRFNIYKQLALFLVKKELRCRGYDVSEEFIEVNHNRCSYFFDEAGFEIDTSPMRPERPPF